MEGGHCQATMGLDGEETVEKEDSYARKMDRNEEVTMFPRTRNRSKEDGKRRGTQKRIKQEVDSKVTPIGEDVGMIESAG